jgi:hypothetical protein
MAFANFCQHGPIANGGHVATMFCMPSVAPDDGSRHVFSRRSTAAWRQSDRRGSTATLTLRPGVAVASSTASGGSGSRSSRLLLIGCRSPQRPKTELTGPHIVSEK